MVKATEVRPSRRRGEAGMPEADAVVSSAQEFAQRFSGASEVEEDERSVPSMLIDNLGRHLKAHPRGGGEG